MNASKLKVIVSLIATSILLIAAVWLFPQRDSQAQAVKQLHAPLTALLQVPGHGRFTRFEDPEYKVVCYLSEGGAFSCVKQ